MNYKIRIDGRNFDFKALKTDTAKDAVRLPMDIDALEVRLQAVGVDTSRLNIRAAKRSDYLQNPNLGRRLAQESLDLIRTQLPDQATDIAVVVADCLSAIAIQRNAAPFFTNPESNFLLDH